MKLHPAIEAAHEAIDNAECTPIHAATCKGLIEGYHTRWASQHVDIETIECEKTYEGQLYNHKSNRDSRTFTLAGKIDKRCLWSGKQIVVDHKTTSLDIADPAGDYWRQLQVEGQPYHYELLLRQNGITVDGVVWDVIKKPGIKPRKITKAEQAEIQSTRSYFGARVHDLSVVHESSDLRFYQARLANLCRQEGEKYFQRRAMTRTHDELLDYNALLWDVAQDLLVTRREDRHYCNAGACMQYGRPCTYLGICANHDSVDSSHWVPRERHPELDGLNGDDGCNVLTNSRVRCYQTCKRLHKYRYEVAIERSNEETAESLTFGRLMHEALDVWWLTI